MYLLSSTIWSAQTISVCSCFYFRFVPQAGFSRLLHSKHTCPATANSLRFLVSICPESSPPNPGTYSDRHYHSRSISLSLFLQFKIRLIALGVGPLLILFAVVHTRQSEKSQAAYIPFFNILLQLALVSTDFQNIKHLTAATKQIQEKDWNGAMSTSISVQQAAMTQDLPAKGPVWVSKFITSSPSHDDNSRELLLGLSDEANSHNIHYDRPSCEPLSCEWTCYRDGVEAGTPEPLLPENEKFQKLVEGTKSPLTIVSL